jgi:hypothetical protein
MSIKAIVSSVQVKLEEMGGGEQFLGKMSELAAECGANGKDEVFDWMIDLGDGLAEKGLVLLSGPGKPDDLYAKPKED